MTEKRLDHIGLFMVGVPQDIGWGWAIWNANNTLTRTCKGCGVSATSPIDRKTKKVAQARIEHRDDCPVIDRVGNDRTWS